MARTLSLGVWKIKYYFIRQKELRQCPCFNGSHSATAYRLFRTQKPLVYAQTAQVPVRGGVLVELGGLPQIAVQPAHVSAFLTRFGRVGGLGFPNGKIRALSARPNSNRPLKQVLPSTEDRCFVRL